MSHKRYEYSAGIRRTRRNRARVKASGRLRLSVFRSARHIYAQIIDDNEAITMVAASSLEPVKAAKGKKAGKSAAVSGGNKAAAAVVGKLIAERAIQAGISEVAFDRGPYPYHGRVQALAEGARSAGLKF